MNKDHCLKLCLAVYKITKPFPEEEPLKLNIRKRVNDILVNLISVNPSATLIDKKKFFKDVEILNSYFEIAQQQNWVHPDNFTILRREFIKLKQEFSGTDMERFTECNPPTPMLRRTKENIEKSSGLKFPEKVFGGLQERQKKILEIMKEKKECQISDFVNVFQGISRRTIQRDLEFLVERGLIKRQGEYRNMVYCFA